MWEDTPNLPLSSPEDEVQQHEYPPQAQPKVQSQDTALTLLHNHASLSTILDTPIDEHPPSKEQQKSSEMQDQCPPTKSSTDAEGHGTNESKELEKEKEKEEEGEKKTMKNVEKTPETIPQDTRHDSKMSIHPPSPTPPLSLTTPPSVLPSALPSLPSPPPTTPIATYHYTHPSNLLLTSLSSVIGGLIHVHVPKHWLSLSNSNVIRRYVWGNELYTDDSDIVAMLFHSSYLSSSGHLLSSPPSSSSSSPSPPSMRKEKTSLLVTIRILPPLPLYIGSRTPLIHSRSYAGHHGTTLHIESVTPSPRRHRRSKADMSIREFYRADDGVRFVFNKAGPW